MIMSVGLINMFVRLTLWAGIATLTHTLAALQTSEGMQGVCVCVLSSVLFRFVVFSVKGVFGPGTNTHTSSYHTHTHTCGSVRTCMFRTLRQTKSTHACKTPFRNAYTHIRDTHTHTQFSVFIFEGWVHTTHEFCTHAVRVVPGVVSKHLIPLESICRVVNVCSLLCVCLFRKSHPSAAEE